MKKDFLNIKSLLPSPPNSKQIIQRINYFLLPIINIKMIHTFCSTQVYKSQEENQTTKIILRLNSFV